MKIQVSVSDVGWYKCKFDDGTESAERELTVKGRRTVTLTADRTVIPPGGRVTLTCAVEDPAGFKYQWFKQTSDSSDKTPLPTENVSESNRVISQGGKYTCFGWRSEPAVVTPDSDAVVIEETVSNRATLTLQPNWPQIFSGETITLRCEIKDGGDTEWTYEWYKDNLKTTTTSNEYRIISATEAHSGEHRCKGRRDSYSSTRWSDAIKLTVSSNRPKAELRADDRDIPVGGSVTLTCSVNPSSGWKYFWYRGEKTSEPLTTQLSAGRIRVSLGGVYWCRGGRGEPVYYTEYSDPITISNSVHNKAVVTLQPNWSEIYRGETITLRCEIKDGGDTEWEYEWKTTSSEKPSNLNEHRIFATESHSGDYRCKGRKKSEKSSTDWSDPFKLTVSDKPRPVLTVSPSWLSAGASVTLNCSVEDQSAGWRFYWYKTVPDPSNNYYSYELLPGSSSGTEQDSYIVHGQTHTAGYMCRAGRGDPVSYTYYSEPKFVWSADFHSSASLTVSPDRAQHFTSDSVSLSCEGNSAEWRVKRLSAEDRYLSDCSTWRTMTGSTCNIDTYRRSDAVYWCESGSGEFSNAVNITIQDKNMILLSPARPVTEGESVSLSCKLRSQTFDSTVFFYHNEKLIQSDTRWELNISAVSKSDEGFYKCQHSGQESAQSWMSVQDSYFVRPVQSESANADRVDYENDHYSALLHGDVCLYETVRGRQEAEHDSVFVRPVQSESANANREDYENDHYSTLLHGDVCLYDTIRGRQEAEHARRRTVILTADRTIIPPGGSVTLTCAVEDPAGFKYQWFRQTSDSSGKTPLQTENVSESNRVISQGGTYTCYGWRSEPDVITPDSNAVVIEETVSNKATLTLQPNWPQIFSGETITLRCEIKYGGNTEWTYEWYKDNLKTTTTSNEYRIISATEAHSGEHRCKGRRDSYFSTEWSDVIKLTVSSNRPKAELRADDRDIPVGGSVTLTCSVNPSAGWKYFWYRGEKTSEHLTTQLSAGRRSVSHGGVYWCRGGRGEPVYYTEYSDPITISNNVHNKAVVTLQPNWSEIYRGETITLRCEIKDGGDTEWEYEWKTTSSEKPSNLNEHRICATASHGGDYWCKGRKKSEKSSTDWSDPFKLTVSDKPRPVLTVSPSWLSAGASVTLNCSVEDPSAGWRFYWYKTAPDPSNNYYSYELLPGSSSGTEQDSYIVHGQTHTAGYVCRAGRGDPVSYTYYSKPEFVWSADFHSSASLTVSPDRAQHFTSDSVSLSCEGNSTEWRVKRLSAEDRYLSDCSTWGTKTGSTCNIKTYRCSDAVYWCESGSGEFSSAVNITIQDKNMILLSPARPVTEGDSVSLSCKLRSQTFDSTVFFYHNEKLIQSDTRWELNISAVSKSDEGFYKCQHSGQESAQSWMSVQAVSRPESSSFPVPLIVGLVCGIVLIFLLLLLLYRYRPSKDTCFNRPIQFESSNTDQNEAQCNEYSSPQHGKH
ncbi:basement membrane-specific heparan sulfate proteoglycan core protein-like [Pagrus major]|uniref:basement membrane-specific heparan sulfate proteoglycan core protein-like n=1 Tax=Pagrus major TaxID=143350 RepID=UPI003CC8C877